MTWSPVSGAHDYLHGSAQCESTKHFFVDFACSGQPDFIDQVNLSRYFGFGEIGPTEIENLISNLIGVALLGLLVLAAIVLTVWWSMRLQHFPFVLNWLAGTSNSSKSAEIRPSYFQKWDSSGATSFFWPQSFLPLCLEGSEKRKICILPLTG